MRLQVFRLQSEGRGACLVASRGRLKPGGGECYVVAHSVVMVCNKRDEITGPGLPGSTPGGTSIE
eukprot:682376-Pelagomonas_calceolata.AAC.2